MKFSNIPVTPPLSLFVKNIWVFEGKNSLQKTSLPFFADGYPGLMFQQSRNGLKVIPHNREMPQVFLYGQTIKPITLEIDGSYQIIIFQFFPFVLRSFWQIVPESINDNCCYLESTADQNVDAFVQKLNNEKTVSKRIKIISELLLNYFERKKYNLDFIVRYSIQKIIDSKGLLDIKSLAAETSVSIRTLERRFSKETGLSPKQFSIICQFQASLQQLTAKDYIKLTDIVYTNGFADQSHFIRVFKAFTGKTPKAFDVN